MKPHAINPGIQKIRETGGHVTVIMGDIKLEFVTWDFVLGPKGLFFILDELDPWQTDPGCVHSVIGKVTQPGPTTFQIERGNNLVKATLRTLQDGFQARQREIDHSLKCHAERLKTEPETTQKWRSDYLKF